MVWLHPKKEKLLKEVMKSKPRKKRLKKKRNREQEA